MENGVANVGGSHEEEMKRAGDGISGERKVGSDELQDLEGEEVFEEAMDVKEPVHGTASIDDTVGEDGEVDEDVLLPSGLGNENLDSEQDGNENFVEAIGIPNESGEQDKEKAAVDGQNLHQGVENVLPKDVVDSGGTENSLVSDESHGIEGDGEVGREHNDGKEMPVDDAGRQTEVSEDGGTLDLNHQPVIQGSEKVTSENSILVQTSTDVKSDGNTDGAVGSISDSLEAGSNKEMVNVDAIVEESKEDEVQTESKHEGIEEQLSAVPQVEFQDSNGKAMEESLICNDDRIHEEKIEDLKEGQMGIKETSVDIGGNKSREEFNYLSSKQEEGSNQEVDVPKVGLGLDQDGKFGVLEDPSPVTHAFSNGSILPADNGSTPSFENVATDNSLTTAAATDVEPGNHNGEPLETNDDAVRGDQNDIVEVPQNEKLEGKSGTGGQSTPVREQYVQPAADLTSVKSASSTPSPSRPAGLGRAAPLLEPAPRVVQQARANGSVSQTQAQQVDDPTNVEAEEYDETREKLQMIRVKFLRLAHRLGQTPHNVVVAQVLYRLGLAEQLRGRNGGRVGAFSFDRASAMAEQLEASGQEPLDFSCTIMVLGKSGVGKSATINSIFDEIKFSTDAFQTGTKRVQDVIGTVQGIKVRVIDTPGLLPSWSDQRHNEKILHSVKRFIKRTQPDIVLYLDRLDVQNRDFGDMPLLRTITDIFGPSIWFNAIVVLTHAASAPPDGPNGTASSYDMFVTQRSHVVQQAIRQAAGDMRLMNPVSLVENHSACRTNRAGQRVLPNGQVWKPHLLLLSFASKILAEANALLKLQDSPPGKPFTARSRAPPLPFLLSSLLQTRPQLKLPEEQFGDEDGLDDDLDESSDSDDEQELDELPPFKPLTKAQMDKLSKAQRKAYFDELDYREKLFMKKQLKEEKKRRKMAKKMAASVKDLPDEFKENVEEESGGAASVPVPMPDLALPASFDSDNPTHRYRYLDSSNQWLVRPVLETHGWDHDVGYEGINVERLFVVKEKVPLSFSGQVTKDKKDANVQMEVASSIKHGDRKVTTLGFDMQSVGKDLAYTLRSETIISNFWRNKATAGLSFTLLGDALSAGVKVEDKLIANKQFKMVVTGGAMTGRGDIAYGGSLEAQLRDKDYPLGRSLSTLGLSVMDWHGDLAIGCNIQSQVPIGRSTNLIARGSLNNRGSGQVSVRVTSSEQLQIALIGLLPLLKKLVGYSPQWQFGQG